MPTLSSPLSINVALPKGQSIKIKPGSSSIVTDIITDQPIEIGLQGGIVGPFSSDAMININAVSGTVDYSLISPPPAGAYPIYAITDQVSGQPVLIAQDGLRSGYATKVNVLARARAGAISAQFNLANSNTAGANFTWETQKKAKIRPIGIRVGHCNQSTVAMSLQVGVYTPTDAASTGTTETKYDLGTLICPAGEASGANVTPTIALTSILFQRGVDRTDGKTGYLYRARVYQSALIQGAALPNTTPIDQYNSVADSEIFYKAVAGNQVLTNVAATGLQARIIPSLIQFIYDVPTLSVMSCDDSLKRGQGSTSGFWSAEAIACEELTSQSLVFELNNQSIAGRTYENSVAAAIPWLRARVCDVLVIKNHSPNSLFTADAFAKSEILLDGLINEAIANGIRVILCTQGPWGLDAINNDRLLAYNAATILKYTGRTGVYIVDEHAIMVDPANPRFARATDVVNIANDQHYSMAGYTRLSTEGIKPALRFLTN